MFNHIGRFNILVKCKGCKMLSLKASNSKITPRLVNYSKWYQDVLAFSDLIDSSPTRGCVVIRPWGMSVWEEIRTYLDAQIKKHGVKNAYFPMLIPQSFFTKEAEHVSGFAKECAVVTHHRLSLNPKTHQIEADPSAELEEPLIVRPTSETIIWHSFSRWIQSHRDLPLKINQWANIVRWEMRTRPFLRTSEFLWQEGHTAHASASEAKLLCRDILHSYEAMCSDLLAVPVIRGAKSPSERFSGALDTYTIEGMMQNGWALQCGTSHFLGQNFGRAFNVQFSSGGDGAQANTRTTVWGTSWGVSTRLMGAVIMCHSDDKGLVLPPKIAPVQVVIVPIPDRDTVVNDQVKAAIAKIEAELQKAGVRVEIDARSELRPGAKYFLWEQKGVPFRISFGKAELQSTHVNLITRLDKRLSVSLENIGAGVSNKLEEFHSELFASALKRLEQSIVCVTQYSDMKLRMVGSGAAESDEESLPSAFFLAPWCCNADNEAAIKDDCKATIRCYPLCLNEDDSEHQSKDTRVDALLLEKAKSLIGNKKCFYSGLDATHIAVFARAF